MMLSELFSASISGKRIDKTLKYTHLVDLEEDEYVSRVAQTVTDACTLIDSGFEYVCDIGGNKIFRKRKHLGAGRRK